MTERPLVGAIRWDTWHGERGEPGKAVQRALGPTRWHHRLPFFAQVAGDDRVRIDGASPAVMDREIGFARDARLDYWAFVTYPPGDPMSLGLDLYLASPRRRDIRFCLITEQGRWGTRRNHTAPVRRFVRLLSEETYLRVQGDRPLLYLGFVRDDHLAREWGGVGGFRDAVDLFRSLALRSGAGNPYIVLMDFDPDRAARLAQDLGCDAIGAYATSGGGSDAPYADLAAHTERFWDRCRATGADVVPVVMSGWDRRPRVARPVPWEPWQKPGEGMDRFYRAPAPGELASHLRRALDWIDRHPGQADARTALIYAWNENDEGGWLVPTLSEGDARLNALRAVLAPGTSRRGRPESAI